MYKTLFLLLVCASLLGVVRGTLSTVMQQVRLLDQEVRRLKNDISEIEEKSANNIRFSEIDLRLEWENSIDDLIETKLSLAVAHLTDMSSSELKRAQGGGNHHLKREVRRLSKEVRSLRSERELCDARLSRVFSSETEHAMLLTTSLRQDLNSAKHDIKQLKDDFSSFKVKLSEYNYGRFDGNDLEEKLERRLEVLNEQVDRLNHTQKEDMRFMRMLKPRIGENEDVHRWVISLQVARVTDWGEMMSTPDAGLQAVIKRALIDSGCPTHIVNELIENSQERRWPTALSTLEIRKRNRGRFEKYTLKRISVVRRQQAVVVMASENQHMPEDFIMEPGLVMIFADGVE